MPNYRSPHYKGPLHMATKEELHSESMTRLQKEEEEKKRKEFEDPTRFAGAKVPDIQRFLRQQGMMLRVRRNRAPTVQYAKVKTFTAQAIRTTEDDKGEIVTSIDNDDNILAARLVVMSVYAMLVRQAERVKAGQTPVVEPAKEKRVKQGDEMDREEEPLTKDEQEVMDAFTKRNIREDENINIREGETFEEFKRRKMREWAKQEALPLGHINDQLRQATKKPPTKAWLTCSYCGKHKMCNNYFELQEAVCAKCEARRCGRDYDEEEEEEE